MGQAPEDLKYAMKEYGNTLNYNTDISICLAFDLVICIHKQHKHIC